MIELSGWIKLIRLKPSILTFFKKSFHKQKNTLHLQPQRVGIIAQLVEQRTENPCVAGSIPADTTKLDRSVNSDAVQFFFITTACGQIILV